MHRAMLRGFHVSLCANTRRLAFGWAAPDEVGVLTSNLQAVSMTAIGR